ARPTPEDSDFSVDVILSKYCDKRSNCDGAGPRPRPDDPGRLALATEHPERRPSQPADVALRPAAASAVAGGSNFRPAWRKSQRDQGDWRRGSPAPSMKVPQGNPA